MAPSEDAARAPAPFEVVRYTADSTRALEDGAGGLVFNDRLAALSAGGGQAAPSRG